LVWLVIVAPNSAFVAPATGSSGNGALGNVTVDLALHDAVPSVFRQSRKTAKDAGRQLLVVYEVRQAVTNKSPDHR
jgi:hypothetical protein